MSNDRIFGAIDNAPDAIAYLKDKAERLHKTLRDEFAAKAIEGAAIDPQLNNAIASLLAKHAYIIADAMLAERDK